MGRTCEFEIHDVDDGKQVHWPTFDMTSCKHGHDFVVQFAVRQPTKIQNEDVLFYYC